MAQSQTKKKDNAQSVDRRVTQPRESAKQHSHPNVITAHQFLTWHSKQASAMSREGNAFCATAGRSGRNGNGARTAAAPKEDASAPLVVSGGANQAPSSKQLKQPSPSDHRQQISGKPGDDWQAQRVRRGTRQHRVRRLQRCPHHSPHRKTGKRSRRSSASLKGSTSASTRTKPGSRCWSKRWCSDTRSKTYWQRNWWGCSQRRQWLTKPSVNLSSCKPQPQSRCQDSHACLIMCLTMLAQTSKPCNPEQHENDNACGMNTFGKPEQTCNTHCLNILYCDCLT